MQTCTCACRITIIYINIDSEKQYLCKYVYDGGHVCVGCGKRRSINRRSLDDDIDAERVNSGFIGVVAILGLS